jgi:glycerol-3-phosphate acyltransferase PlsX
MVQAIRIAIDAMGGDNGPAVVLAGADIALVRRPELRYQLFGEEKAVLPLLESYPRVKAASTFTHCEVTVQMDDKPSQALRYGRLNRRCGGPWTPPRPARPTSALSAGNTGALMAMSKFCLKSMPRSTALAIACLWPTVRGESIVLDVGATINADARHSSISQ